LPAHLFAHPSLSIPAIDAFQLQLTPFNSTPTGRDRPDADGDDGRRARHDGGDGGVRVVRSVRGGGKVGSVRGAFYCIISHALVPIRPRSRGERRSLRTFAVVSLRPSGSLAFKTRPRCLSTPPLTPFNSTRPDVNSSGVRARGRRRGDRRVLRRQQRRAPADDEGAFCTKVFHPSPGFNI
jgi:hypothetical protein